MSGDEQILADQRAKHGDPYMPLSVAKEMQRLERKWAHMTASYEKRAREGKLPIAEPCRYGNGTCLSHRSAKSS